MPTVPLLETPEANADASADPRSPYASHRVIAPGGYEWWHFHARDPSTDLRVQIDLFDGDPLNRTYRRAYARYRRRPTRVAPPVPCDFPNFCIAVRRKGETLWLFSPRTIAPGAFHRDDVNAAYAVGPVSARFAPDGAATLTIGGAEAIDFSGVLTFRPRGAERPVPRRLDSEDPAIQHWCIEGQIFDVTGSLRLPRPRGARQELQPTIHGEGAVMQRFGTGPLPCAI